MGHSEDDPAAKDRPPWNAGRKLGAKRALKSQQVWAIRFWLDRERRLRDRALFDLAIDSKLRGCDVVKIKISELVSAVMFAHERSSFSRRPVGPCSSSSWSLPVAASWLGLNVEEARSMTSPFRAGPIRLSISAPASMLVSSTNG